MIDPTRRGNNKIDPSRRTGQGRGEKGEGEDKAKGTQGGNNV